MFLKIIGSAAGGGFPQWNCNYYLSQNARNHHQNFKPRTQSSLIATKDYARYVLFNASPDLREQINNTKELHPINNGTLRSTPIKAIVLTNADIDHIAGLLTLRERQAFVIYATKRVLDVLASNSVFNVLDSELVQKKELPLNGKTEILDSDGQSLGLIIETYSVSGKIALFLEDETLQNFGSSLGDTIGINIIDAENNASVSYIPGCAAIDNNLKKKVKNSDCLLFDGTLFTDDEMVKAGLSHKTGQRMGHISIFGENGSIALWQDIDLKRKIFVHINNSNPVLDDASFERKSVEKAGWEIAYDGMELKIDRLS